jgi:hypothetical protein
LDEGPPRWPLRDHPVRALKRQPVAARGGERVTRAPPAAPRVCSLAPRRGQQQRSPPSFGAYTLAAGTAFNGFDSRAVPVHYVMSGGLA